MILLGLNMLNLESAKVLLYSQKIQNQFDYKYNIQNLLIKKYRKQVLPLNSDLQHRGGPAGPDPAHQAPRGTSTHLPGLLHLRQKPHPELRQPRVE